MGKHLGLILTELQEIIEVILGGLILMELREEVMDLLTELILTELREITMVILGGLILMEPPEVVTEHHAELIVMAQSGAIDSSN
tara:strand:+ start:240 stop:494 length:255 start_codon:yes stop_codon:yes gene_type:complete